MADVKAQRRHVVQEFRHLAGQSGTNQTASDNANRQDVAKVVNELLDCLALQDHGRGKARLQ